MQPHVNITSLLYQSQTTIEKLLKSSIMKTQKMTSEKPLKTNKALGIYTIFMVSLSASYIITTWLQYIGS